jgi:hypothetical protein
MYFSLRRYGRWGDVAQHFVRAERELLSGMSVVMRTLKDAAAPHAKEDALASLMFEVFHFFERLATNLLPVTAPLTDSELVRSTQRRALLAIRDVLLDERAAVTPDAMQTRHRSEVIDTILRVIDRELERLDGFVESVVEALEREAAVQETAPAAH